MYETPGEFPSLLLADDVSQDRSRDFWVSTSEFGRDFGGRGMSEKMKEVVYYIHLGIATKIRQERKHSRRNKENLGKIMKFLAIYLLSSVEWQSWLYPPVIAWSFISNIQVLIRIWFNNYKISITVRQKGYHSASFSFICFLRLA